MPCAGCGFTRALSLAVHGELAEATRLYPLWFVVAPLLGYVVLRDAIVYVRTGRWGTTAMGPRARWVTLAVVVALVAVWIARFFGVLGGPAPV